jgi:hypothetical protein
VGCILGAARAYKPMPEACLASCRQLGLPPSQVMMVAAHNGDLKAAKAQGLCRGPPNTAPARPPTSPPTRPASTLPPGTSPTWRQSWIDRARMPSRQP